ncbi:SDR family NAD(P)-dependent oxidoreductase [Sulfidibacter corallicola]|uniref:SDR family NAD(P)-dependent oxidoreductase n=1 Tax=Sulfidibacter corallicola TaxID=2818388 RepID=A0A8A4TY27_SULCO|nr:SDR family NAD(P)-dependent oxidoreductase [Sulfidibacter corallicola]QTD51435.1 SDR family NAD(P)-dependent oxidoreductase [Sulfidibacter corallicola]
MGLQGKTFELDIDPENLLLRDYHLFGAEVFPPLALLELVFKAAREPLSIARPRLQHIAFHDLLVLHGNEPRILRLDFAACDPFYRVVVSSGPAKGDEREERRQLHLMAECHPGEVWEQEPPQPDALKQKSTLLQDVGVLFAPLPGRETTLGEMLRPTGTTWHHEKNRLAELHLPPQADRLSDHFLLQPAFLEAAFQLAISATLAPDEAGTLPLLPASIGEVRWFEPVGSTCTVVCAAARDDWNPEIDPGTHFEVFNPYGRLVMFMSGIHIQAIDPQAVQSPHPVEPAPPPVSETAMPADELSFRTLRWHSDPKAPTPHIPTNLVLLSHENGLVVSLRKRFPNSRFHLMQAASDFATHDDGDDTVCIDVRPDRADHYDRALEFCLEQSSGTLNLVYLWSWESLGWEEKAVVSRSGLQIHTLNTINQLFYLCRAAIRVAAKWNRTIRLLSFAPDPLFEGIAGFAEALQAEESHLDIRTLNTDLRRGADLAEIVAQELDPDLAPGGIIRYRGGHRSRRVTTEIATPPLSEFPSVLEPGETYLITGGLGSLGSVLAEYLATRYRANLLLVGRRKADTAVESFLQRLRAQGSLIMYRSADVSDPEEMYEALSDAKTELGPIQGVFHCAGRGKEEPFLEESLEAFERIIWPKINGTMVLDQVTSTEPLRFFTLFSRLPGPLGGEGRSADGLADGFLVGFAHYRNTWVREKERQGWTRALSWPAWWPADKAVRGSADSPMDVWPISRDAALGALEQLLDREYDRVLVYPAHAPETSAAPSKRPLEPPAPVADRLTLTPPMKQVVVVGIACRFPTGEDRIRLSCNLYPEDIPSPVPEPLLESLGDQCPRLNMGRWRSVDPFFLGLRPTEARELDPRLRHWLELAVQARCQAGLAPTSINGEAVTRQMVTGMYLSLGDSLLDRLPTSEQSRSVAALGARAAQLLNCGGPVLTLSGSEDAGLAALHLAAGALQRGECDLALVGAVTLAPPSRGSGTPADTVSGGNRHIPSDGGVALLLTTEDMARALCLPVHAAVLASEIDFDHAARNPNPEGPASQEPGRLLDQLLRRHELEAEDITRLEWCGTAPSLTSWRTHATRRFPAAGLSAGPTFRDLLGDSGPVEGLFAVVRALTNLDQDRPQKRDDDFSSTPNALVLGSFIDGGRARFLLSCPRDKSPLDAPSQPLAFCISASDKDTLAKWVRRLDAHAKRRSEAFLPRIAVALRRRPAHGERLVVLAATREELHGALHAFLRGQAEDACKLFRGTVPESHARQAQPHTEDLTGLAAAAHLWVHGAYPIWPDSDLLKGYTPCELPPYPLRDLAALWPSMSEMLADTTEWIDRSPALAPMEGEESSLDTIESPPIEPAVPENGATWQSSPEKETERDRVDEDTDNTSTLPTLPPMFAAPTEPLPPAPGPEEASEQALEIRELVTSQTSMQAEAEEGAALSDDLDPSQKEQPPGGQPPGHPQSPFGTPTNQQPGHPQNQQPGKEQPGHPQNQQPGKAPVAKAPVGEQQPGHPQSPFGTPINIEMEAPFGTPTNIEDQPPLGTPTNIEDRPGEEESGHPLKSKESIPSDPPIPFQNRPLVSEATAMPIWIDHLGTPTKDDPLQFGTPTNDLDMDAPTELDLLRDTVGTPTNEFDMDTPITDDVGTPIDGLDRDFGTPTKSARVGIPTNDLDVPSEIESTELPSGLVPDPPGGEADTSSVQPSGEAPVPQESNVTLDTSAEDTTIDSSFLAETEIRTQGPNPFEAFGIESDALERTLTHSIAPYRKNGILDPVFCLPDLSGTAAWLHGLLPYLDPEIPVYGLTAPGVQPSEKPIQGVRQLAAHFRGPVQARSTGTTIRLMAFGLTGVYAHELVRLLAQDQPKRRYQLIFLDCPAPGAPIIESLLRLEEPNLLASICNQLGLMWQVEPLLASADLLTQKSKARLKKAAEFLAKKGNVPIKKKPLRKLLDHLIGLSRFHQKSILKHQVEALKAELDLYWVRCGTDVSDLNWTTNWLTHLKGAQLTERRAGCTRDAMMREPNISNLAGELNERLRSP